MSAPRVIPSSSAPDNSVAEVNQLLDELDPQEAKGAGMAAVDLEQGTPPLPTLETHNALSGTPKPESTRKASVVMLTPADSCHDEASAIDTFAGTPASTNGKSLVKKSPSRQSSDKGSRFSLRRLRTKKIQEDLPRQFTHTVHVDGMTMCGSNELEIEYDIDGPSTMKWKSDVLNESDGSVVLPAGFIVLYIFPKVITVTTGPDGAPKFGVPTPASPAGVRVLNALLMALATETGALDQPDPVGAYAIHCLMVCNSPQSLELSMALYERLPHWILRVHGKGDYCGESALHIVAVNKREDLLVRLIKLAFERLDPEEVQGLFKAQPTGSFFEGVPMRDYGSTILSYSCSLQHRQAVVALLETGLVSLNERDDSCVLTGFMPLHAVVANCANYVNCSIYDYLTEELKEEWRADATLVTKVGLFDMRDGIPDMCSLTTMQLAAQLGDHATVRHILFKQCQVQWVWGPITSFLLDLNGIDSSGEGGSDVMELIVRSRANRRTQTMLLDSFMNGFIHRMYQVRHLPHTSPTHISHTRCHTPVPHISPDLD